MNKLMAILAAPAITGVAGSGGSPTSPVGPDKAVYHLNEGLPSAIPTR